MAMNCPQLLKPRACRSASCLRTADSNSKREINCKICEKILLTRVKAEPPSFVIGFSRAQSQANRCSAFFLSQIEILIWTSVIALKTCHNINSPRTAVGTQAQKDGVAPKLGEDALRQRVVAAQWIPAYPSFAAVTK